jgi:hypothetical protein
MATKTLRVVRPGRYGTRMLKAGDTFEVAAPDARLFLKLGWAEERAKPYVSPAVDSAKAEVSKIIGRAVSETVAATPAKPKTAPRKRKARAKKKTA